jgi:hypothetical protein
MAAKAVSKLLFIARDCPSDDAAIEGFIDLDQIIQREIVALCQGMSQLGAEQPTNQTAKYLPLFRR